MARPLLAGLDKRDGGVSMCEYDVGLYVLGDRVQPVLASCQPQ